MDAYEKAYEDFRNKRMKPKGKFKMNDETQTNTEANVEVEAKTENGQTVQGVVDVYEQAVVLYNEGKRDEALKLIQDALGEEAAKEAEKAMEMKEAFDEDMDNVKEEVTAEE